VGGNDSACTTSCTQQIVHLAANAGFQSVINTIHTRRQTSTPHNTFCGQDVLDIQDRVSYTSPHKKEVLIKNWILHACANSLTPRHEVNEAINV
jgi:hypothetical protein